MKIIGVIPARYKSSRFPGKPLADILGKPMIWWVYQQAMKVKELEEVYVATDDDRIISVCDELNIRSIKTSDQHPTGSDRVAEVSEKVEADYYINIQGDEPVIKPEMIADLANVFHNKDIYFASLRKEISDIDEINALSTVKVVVDKDNNALYFSRSVIPSSLKTNIITSVYRHVGIYGYSRDFLHTFINLPQSRLEMAEGIEPLRAMENGYKIYVKETKYSSIGVDYPEHIAKVEKYIREEMSHGPY